MQVTPETLRLVRSVVLFVGGFAGAVYEVILNATERPAVLVLLAGMMGLPAFLPGRKPPAATPPPPGEAKPGGDPG